MTKLLVALGLLLTGGCCEARTLYEDLDECLTTASACLFGENRTIAYHYPTRSACEAAQEGTEWHAKLASPEELELAIASAEREPPAGQSALHLLQVAAGERVSSARLAEWGAAFGSTPGDYFRCHGREYVLSLGSAEVAAKARPGGELASSSRRVFPLPHRLKLSPMLAEPHHAGADDRLDVRICLSPDAFGPDAAVRVREAEKLARR